MNDGGWPIFVRLWANDNPGVDRNDPLRMWLMNGILNPSGLGCGDLEGAAAQTRRVLCVAVYRPRCTSYFRIFWMARYDGRGLRSPFRTPNDACSCSSLPLNFHSTAKFSCHRN